MLGYRDGVSDRTQFTRRLLGAVAFAIVFGLACLMLARWQLSRFEEKDARAHAVENNYHAAPVPLASVLSGPGISLREDQVWSQVTVTGVYRPPPLLVRGRALQGTQGMEVLVPLQVDGGGLLLVDRGWVANARDARTLPDFPPAPLGPVTVTGWLKPGEPERTPGLPAGQLGSVNLDEAASQVGGRLYAAYLVLGQESPEVARPTPLEAPTPDRGPHFAYAIQWVLAALLGVGFVVLMVRSRPEAVAAREAAERAAAARDPQPKKVRIWDEEDG